MPEILLLALAIFLIPFLPGQFLWAMLILLIVLPGIFALRHGPPFVPTSRKRVETMIAFAEIQVGNRVYDLGCGDGRLVIAAAKRGATAIGYELSVPMFLFAKARSLFCCNAEIRFGNFWTKDFSDADVIFCYFVTDAMKNFEENIWPTLKPGCRVVSNTFRIRTIPPAKQEGKVAMYIKNSLH